MTTTEETIRDLEELVALLSKYGEAKFGDEWWPGNATAWLDGDEGRRLEALCSRYA